MRPPICAICSKDFRDSPGEGGLVSFELSSGEREYNKRFDQKGIVGHPAGQEWFCGRHYPIAIKYQHLTRAEAIPLIRAKKIRNWLSTFSKRFFGS